MRVEFLEDTNGQFGQVYKTGTVCDVDDELLKQMPEGSYKKAAASKNKKK